jgi:pimeloyl-ACP methyl ester carboxylesterase
VGLHCASLHPGRVASVTLVDSRVRALQPVQRARDWPDYEQIKTMLDELGFDIPGDENDAGLFVLERLARSALRDERRRLSHESTFIPFGGWGGGQRSAQRWVELLDTTTAPRDIRDMAGLTLDAIRNVRRPALALYGELSRSLESCRGLKATVPHCRAVTMPGVGHYFPATRPDLLVAAVLEFISSVERPGRAAELGAAEPTPAALRGN